ncbi:MAG: DUF1565 domain-containing protein [Candidatus Marinimicrobia bacterium]|nr:DUF1565 domain-containing protein [Candidatus Neomarinimicrobiota bacterium]
MKNKVLFVVLLLSSILTGTIIHVPAGQLTIQAGIDIAVDGDTVLVAPGTYFENIIWPATTGIKLIGSGQEDCIIDGNQQASVIRFANSNIDTTTLISDFTITNGLAYSGGGIYCVVNSSPSLVDVTITGNSASSGGGIYLQYSDPSLENVTITGNSASSYGGGIYCYFYSSPSLENVTIAGNSADFGGGGIFCSSSSPSLENVTITGNFASYGGGGISCSRSSPSFSSENRCNIYSNNTTGPPTGRTGSGSGADIYSNSTITVIVDTFTVMTPTEYHASPLDNFTFDILNAVNPQVDADLYVSPSGDNSNDGLTAETPLKTIQYATSIILADSTNPHTIHLANGVYSPSTNGEYFPVEVINYVSLVGESEDNVILDADSVAGVMKCIGVTSSTISHLTLTNGSASTGGGIYCYSSSPSLENVTISNNSAFYVGGGIYFGSSSSPTLENVTITNNSADDSGGGIYCSSSSPSLANVTISGNSADFGGGGIFCSSSSPSLVNCILWNDAPQEVYFYGNYSPNSIIVAYSDIQGGEVGIVTNNNGTVYWEDGNIDLGPLFTDTENGDYTLQENSPCIDTGTAFFVWESDTLVNMTEEEYYGTAPDMGAFESQYTVGIDPLSIFPSTFSLNPAYPNPFNPTTVISYQLSVSSTVTLCVYDITGRLVETLVDGITEPGTYTVKWDASGYSSGVYFVQMVAGKFVETQKVLLMK